jgi:tetratricopeptide (TPR) repeat protein
MPDFAVLLFSAPAAALTIGAWHHWTRDGELSVWLPLVAAAALLLNLLAAGGISFPGVAGSLWILVAMALNLRPGGPARVRVSRTAASLLACLAAVLLLACQHLVYGPVLRAGALLENGHRAWSAGEMREAERVYLEAAAADPWWDEPWQALAALRHQVWWQQPDDVRFLQFYAALERMLTLNPRSSNARALGADWLAAAYLRAGNKEWLAQALAQCRRAVELYPNEALGHARMALLYELAGNRLEAAREAEVALHLDARTPHQEQKLSRRQAFRFPDGLAPWSGNTEQLLQQLRNAQKQN